MATFLLLVQPVRSVVDTTLQVLISHASLKGGSQISPFHANFANVRDICDIPSDTLAFLFFEFTGFIFMIALTGILVERSGVSC